MYYGKILVSMLDNIPKILKKLNNLMGNERIIMIIIRDILKSLGVFGYQVKFQVVSPIQLSSVCTCMTGDRYDKLAFLRDPAARKMINKDLFIEQIPESPTSPGAIFMRKICIDDSNFERELKPFIIKSEPLDQSIVKYMKNYFCDYGLSKTMRRWLWRERIGNGIKVNRTTFNTWQTRASMQEICPEMQAIIRADLVRACNTLERDKNPVRTFCDLEMLIRTFVVMEVHQAYRPDIGYVQGMSAVMLQLYSVTEGEWFETFGLFCNLLLTNSFLFSLYSFDHETVLRNYEDRCLQ